jgi:hypothetical protein
VKQTLVEQVEADPVGSAMMEFVQIGLLAGATHLCDE